MNLTCRTINYPQNQSINSAEYRSLELVLMEQCVASAVEGQAFSEKIHPLIGVLVGSAPPDSNCAIIKSFYRIQRYQQSCISCLIHRNLSLFDLERWSCPADVIGLVNRRIRDEGSMILGYYFCIDAFSSTLSKKESVAQSSAYGIDHVRLLNAIVQTECPRPIVLQVQRIWRSDGDLEASIRFDFFAAILKETTIMNPLNYKILDSAYPSPGILRSIIDSEFIILDEMETHRSTCASGSSDLCFDSNLNDMCINAERRIQALLWNANNRLDMEKLYLKRLIHGRMAQITHAWEAHKTNNSSEHDERYESLIAKLLKKDMPVALADTLRKLPISSHLPFYDRPTIAMKATRLAQSSPFIWGSTRKSVYNYGNEQGNRKRKSSTKVTIPYTKGPPRLILPAGSVSNTEKRSASSSSSSETSTTNSAPNSPPDSNLAVVPKSDPHASETPPLIITIPTGIPSSSK